MEVDSRSDISIGWYEHRQRGCVKETYTARSMMAIPLLIPRKTAFEASLTGIRATASSLRATIGSAVTDIPSIPAKNAAGSKRDRTLKETAAIHGQFRIG